MGAPPRAVALRGATRTSPYTGKQFARPYSRRATLLANGASFCDRALARIHNLGTHICRRGQLHCFQQRTVAECRLQQRWCKHLWRNAYQQLRTYAYKKTHSAWRDWRHKYELAWLQDKIEMYGCTRWLAPYMSARWIHFHDCILRLFQDLEPIDWNHHKRVMFHQFVHWGG